MPHPPHHHSSATLACLHGGPVFEPANFAGYGLATTRFVSTGSYQAHASSTFLAAHTTTVPARPTPPTTYPQVPQPAPPVHFYLALTDTTRRKQLPYPPFEDSKDPDAHVQIFLTATQANRETDFAELINLFGYSLREGTSKWFSNYITDFPNTAFDDLIIAFRKRYRMINSEEEAYKQLHQLTHVNYRFVLTVIQLTPLTSCPNNPHITITLTWLLIPYYLVSCCDSYQVTLVNLLRTYFILVTW